MWFSQTPLPEIPCPEKVKMGKWGKNLKIWENLKIVFGKTLLNLFQEIFVHEKLMVPNCYHDGLNFIYLGLL